MTTTTRHLMVFKASTYEEVVFPEPLPSRLRGESDEAWVARGTADVRERLTQMGRTFRQGPRSRGDSLLRVVVTGGERGISAEREILLVGSLRLRLI